uniref:rRNA N-glycosylase n=1 Tax=Oryza punctata TaxID=4537 RepID=A0A0E0KHL0_ORYPU
MASTSPSFAGTAASAVMTRPVEVSKSSSHSAACRRSRRKSSHSAGLLFFFFFALLFLAVYLLDLSAGHGGRRRGGSVSSAAASLSARQAGISADDVFLIDLDDGEATLAAHRHSLSFAGFADRSNHWHVFRGDEDAIPNARRLPFRNNYRDLIGGIENLPGLPLGRAAAAEAAEALASYDAHAAGEEETAALKRAVAALSVMLAEAMRLKPIRETVSNGWESGEARTPSTHGGSTPAAEHLPYIEHLDTMSFEVIRWKRTGKWDGPFTGVLRKSAGIHSADEALAIAKLLANPTLAQLILAHSTT